MPTTKKRLNLSLPKWMEEALIQLAKKDEMPLSTKAVELLKEAIELQEDIYFSQLVDERIANNKGFISHEEAWS